MAKEIKRWTVISIDDTTGEVTKHTPKATEPHEAMRLTARKIHKTGEYSDIQILCALGGNTMVCACEDVGKAAYVVDLIGDEETPEICECGRAPEDCATYDDAEADHADR